MEDDADAEEEEERGPFTWREGTDVSREDETAVTAIAVEPKSMRKAGFGFGQKKAIAI